MEVLADLLGPGAGALDEAGHHLDVLLLGTPGLVAAVAAPHAVQCSGEAGVAGGLPPALQAGVAWLLAAALAHLQAVLLDVGGEGLAGLLLLVPDTLDAVPAGHALHVVL